MNVDTPERSDAGTPYEISNCPAWPPESAVFGEPTPFLPASARLVHFSPGPHGRQSKLPTDDSPNSPLPISWARQTERAV